MALSAPVIVLEVDDDGYPQLPEDVLDQSLGQQKKVIRAFVNAVWGESLVLMPAATLF